MKNFNLIKRLFMDSHEKQSPQRFARYAVMLLMLLSLGVGQMWATKRIYIDFGDYDWPKDGACLKVWDGSSNVSITQVSGKLYKADIADAVTTSTTLYFKRLQSDCGNDYDGGRWNEANCKYSSTYNCYQFTGWGAVSASYNISTVSKTNYIYFNNATTGWTNTYKYFVIGHDRPSAHSKVYALSSISNTKLLYVAQSSNDWSDVTYYGFNASNSSYSNGDWGTSSYDDASKYVAPYTSKYDMNSGSSYYCVPSAAANNSSFSITYKDGYDSIPKFNAVQAAKKRDTGTTYSSVSGSYPATLSLQGTYLSGNGTSNQSSISSTASTDAASKTTYGTVVTGEVTHSYSSLSSSYYFEGWGTGSTPSVTTASHSYNISAATTTYAFFSKVYALTYDSKGTKGSSSISVDIADFSGTKTSGSSIPTGHEITFTASPATGYEVEGWYSDASCTSPYTSSSGGVTISGSGNVTFTLASLNAAQAVYCKFRPKTYSITLDDNGSYDGNGSATATYYTTTLTSIDAPDRTGYHVTGYYTNDATPLYISDASGNLQASKTGYTDGSSRWTKDDDATLYAHWDANTYSVTLDKNGGDSDGSITTTYDSSTGSSFSAASYAGYSCDGYFTEDDGGYEIIDKDGNLKTGTVSGWLSSGAWVKDGANIKLYAHWTEDITNYTVTYDVVGHGSLSAANSSTSASINSGDEVANGTGVAFTAEPDDYYEVEGWYTDDECTEGKHDAGETEYSTTISSADLGVYVKFQPITYTISYTLNGGSNHGSNPDSYNYESSAITLQDPSRTGYTFAGWYTESTFVNRVYSIAAKSNGNKAFWAKWTANTYDVAFNANGGSGSMSNQDFTYDVAQSLTSNAYTRAGYTFGGWATSKANADAGTKAYNNSQSVSNLSSTDGATVTLWAIWTARPYKIVYFAMPQGWTNVYAYAWKSSDDTKRNANWPGVQLNNSAAGTGSVIENGVTYYYYKYYTDGLAGDSEGNGTGNDKEPGNWNYLKFNNGSGGTEGSTETRRVNISTGHYYWLNEAQGSTGTSAAAVWYVKGAFPSHSWDTNYPISFASDSRSGSVLVDGLTASTSYSFKIYLAKATGEWYKYTGGPDATYDADYNITSKIGTELTLRTYNNNNNTFTTATTSYRFSLDVTNTDHPVLVVAPGDDADYSVTVATNGHGSISQGTGSKTIHKYAPTTLTAVAEPGYRFTGWTVDSDHNSNVSFSPNASSATATVTGVAGASGATITANFSNEGFVYFDASAVSGFSGGGKVYVTYLKSNDLSWDGTTGALIVKNWISDALHNQEMTRIPNTNIYYFYTATTPQGKILFTSKSHAGSDYKLWEMAAVVREDFNVGQDNMFVAENWVLQDKNKTGYYGGYWMKYNETDPGVQLCIYSMASGTPHISGSPFSFTRTEEGSRIYTTKVTGLTANTQYGIEIKGLNGTYYKNRGEMTSTNAVGGWEYVDREATRGTIRTTAAGDYDVQLSCSDKLILAVDFPLAVGDYQVKYSGKDSVGGNTITNASSVIRHIGAVGSKNDTVSFFVVKGDSWTLQLQKCTAVSPSITWANVGSAKTAADFGTPETGVYNFVVKQDSASGTPVTPSFATMTPIAYTGNYYIRTDAAAGGWEAYKKSMDNRMVFSNYPKQHSNYDHYHCHYSTSGKNVKFCIANDYSGQLSVVMTTDSYVNSYGNLYADANVRFMWNSETNVVRRAYLNGSSTTDFLVLAAKNDSVKNADGTAISKSGDYNQVKFEDKNNWVYQKEVQALEGTHYRLTSNYRYSGADHIQYFKGSDGDWTPAHTELLIGGTTSSWQTLRLIYDFKTNHLTAAWLPPTTDITTAKHIEADMLLIRTSQNAAQQLTFTGSGSVADVKTMIGAIELRYDSIVGRVGNFDGDAIGGNRANRELMYYISFPFDVAVSDIYGFGQLNKEWYLQYYDGAERASKGWFKGDGTTTFWKFMTLSDTLKANVGYSLLLDNDYFNAAGTGTVWEHMKSGDKIYLYFPSAKELDGSKVIKTGSAALPVPSHECTIDRTFVSENSGRTVNHKFTDSHWNMMGVPLFQNQTSVGTDKFIAAISTEDPQELVPFPANTGYFYEWDSLANTLSVRTTSGYTFKAMHGYMVQFTGTVGFSGSSIQPASVVARRAKLNRDNYTLELQLLQNNKRVSRTYVELREEACDTFALNEDVYMVYTSQPADLFTLAGNYDVSANVLSENDHIIPVGVEVHKAGTYTFSMPGNFSGSVTLVDNELNTRTNLALSDYEVTLPKGVCEGRFSVEIGIRKTPTSIDVIEDGGSLKDGKAHKFIMNDQMYIIKNGVIYDAQGKRVK